MSPRPKKETKMVKVNYSIEQEHDDYVKALAGEKHLASDSASIRVIIAEHKMWKLEKEASNKRKPS